MTAPAPSPYEQAEIDRFGIFTDRDRLVTWLRPAEPWPHAPSPEVIADALLPVVDRIANERAAAELREAADRIATGWYTTARDLRARADELDAE